MSGSESETRANTPASPTFSSSRERVASSSIEKSAEGDRVAVGIVRRVAQLGRDDLLELAGEHVLEDLGLGVDPIPRDLEDLRQEELEQAVVADDLERDATAVGGQAHAAIGRVLGEPELVELAHHGRDRAGRDSSRSARALVATFAAPSWPSE